MFNEAEAERQPITPEPQIEEITYKRKKSKKRKQDEIYGNLPVEEIVYDIPTEEKICEKCGTEMSFMKHAVRTELKFTPAKLTAVKHKRAVYVCKNCDQKSTESNFKTAKAAPSLIEKSLASPSLLSHIMIQKFCNAMPLYRQEQDFERLGVHLSRQTMANWMIKGANLLKPLYENLQNQLVANKFIHADETTLEVLHEKAELRQPNRTCGYTEPADIGTVRLSFTSMRLAEAEISPKSFCKAFAAIFTAMVGQDTTRLKTPNAAAAGHIYDDISRTRLMCRKTKQITVPLPVRLF